MSVVDWSKAPEGAVAIGFALFEDREPAGYWVLMKSLSFLLESNFGFAPGTVTLRPSAAEAELRAEVERLRAENSAACKLLKDEIGERVEDEFEPVARRAAKVINWIATENSELIVENDRMRSAINALAAECDGLGNDMIARQLREVLQ